MVVAVDHAVVEGKYLLFSSYIILSYLLNVVCLISYVSFLSTDAVHRLDATRETSVEFAQLAVLVVEGKHLLLLSVVDISYTSYTHIIYLCIVYFLLNRCCSSTGCGAGDKCGVCSACSGGG